VPVRKRNLLLGSAAVCLAVLVIGAAGSASGAKRCGKHKKHCDKSKTFDRLADHSLKLVTSDVPPFHVRYDFCPGGGYGYSSNGTTYDGQPVRTTYHGYWRVVSSQGASGVVQDTVKGFSSTVVDGQTIEQPPPSPIAKTVTFGPFGIYFGGVLYSRGKARCK
jgi:hypothetical protein